MEIFRQIYDQFVFVTSKPFATSPNVVGVPVTPAILPVPTVPASAVVTAWKPSGPEGQEYASSH